MTLLALDKDDLLIENDHGIKKGEYYCQYCKESLFFKKGRTRISHFSHYPSSECQMRKESYFHLISKYQLKKYLFEKLNMDVYTEKRILINNGFRIADIYIPFKNLIIEIQTSPITVQEWKNRERDYHRANYNTLWLFNYQIFFDKKVNTGYYRQIEIIRYLSVFYPILILDYIKPNKLYCLELGSRKVNESEFYSEDGEELYYTYTCKTLRSYDLWETDWNNLRFEKYRPILKKKLNNQTNYLRR